MNNEQIKEIVIAMIQKDQFELGGNGEDKAKDLALFIKTLKKELKEDTSLRKDISIARM